MEGSPYWVGSSGWSAFRLGGLPLQFNVLTVGAGVVLVDLGLTGQPSLNPFLEIT